MFSSSRRAFLGASLLGGSELGDFAGKFVLLIIWSDARKPTDDDLTFLKLAQERHKKDGNSLLHLFGA